MYSFTHPIRNGHLQRQYTFYTVYVISVLTLFIVGCGQDKSNVDWILASVSNPPIDVSMRIPEDDRLETSGGGGMDTHGNFVPIKGETIATGSIITKAAGQEFTATFGGAENIYSDPDMTNRTGGAYKIVSGDFVVTRTQLLEATSKSWTPNRFEVVPLDKDYVILRMDQTKGDQLSIILRNVGGSETTAGWSGTIARYGGHEFSRRPDGWYSDRIKVSQSHKVDAR